MSRIVSPHPKARVVIDIDEQTGVISSNITKAGLPYELPLMGVISALASLINQYILDARQKELAQTGKKSGDMAGQSPVASPNGGTDAAKT